MIKKLIAPIVLLVVIVSIYGLNKPLPENVSYKGEVISIHPDDIHFLKDITYTNKDGERTSEQEIFDEVYKMIDDANSYILLDFFLFNDFKNENSYRNLSDELTNKLIEKKQSNPNITIQFITDPINEFYYGLNSPQLNRLEENGIRVIRTDLTALRDSNPIYSGFWRTFAQWLGSNRNGGFSPNPLDPNSEKVTFRSYLRSFNFKANHRKLIIADKDGEFSTLVTTANPHDGSSAHSNSAIKIDTLIAKDVLKTEKAIANFSNIDFIDPPEELLRSESNIESNTQVQLLTEGKIRDKIIESIDSMKEGDELDMAMFYIADRKIIKALKEADEKGIKIRLLLDANKDAFGNEKNGMPNRQIASELMKNTNGNTKVRWCATSGEQCHSKLLILNHSDGYEMFLGSANLTRRNIGDFNLETNVRVISKDKIKAIADAINFFDITWNNKNDRIFSLDYEKFKEDDLFKKLLFRLTERIGTNRW